MKDKKLTRMQPQTQDARETNVDKNQPQVPDETLQNAGRDADALQTAKLSHVTDRAQSDSVQSGAQADAGATEPRVDTAGGEAVLERENEFVRFFRLFWKKALFPFLRGLGNFFKKLAKHRKGRTGLIMVGIIMIAAIFAPLLTPYNLDTPDVTQGLLKPSWAHWLGTDKNGYDILTQLLYGTRVSLIIGLTTSLCVTAFGAILGIIAGYFGKVASGIILNVINVLLVIPTLPLMIVMNKISSSYVMMIIIFVAFGWCGTARVIRAQVLTLKNMNYVKQAELAGANRWYVMFKHILPSVSHLLIMNCAIASAGFMIAEAGLSFIGLGDPNAISWGKVLVNAEQSAFTSGLWAWVLAPGVAIFITVYGFMQLGYAIEDIFNPRLKHSAKAHKLFKSVDNSEVSTLFSAMDDASVTDSAALMLNFSSGAVGTAAVVAATDAPLMEAVAAESLAVTDEVGANRAVAHDKAVRRTAKKGKGESDRGE